jgi:anti-sigma regulatory factor (Ser/Thr protein kinase)
MSIEMVSAKEQSSSWEIKGTELPNGFMVRFIGHDVTKPEQVSILHNKVAEILAQAAVDPDTCFSAKLIISELAANAIENGKHQLSELDVVVLYTPEGEVSEVYISVINPVDEDVRLEYRKRERTADESAQEESGRGRDLTDALTSGNWGWVVTDVREGNDETHEQLSVVTFARLEAAGHGGIPQDELHRAS